MRRIRGPGVFVSEESLKLEQGLYVLEKLSKMGPLPRFVRVVRELKGITVKGLLFNENFRFHRDENGHLVPADHVEFFRDDATGYLRAVQPYRKSSTGAVCPCGRDAPLTKNSILAFRWWDDSLGFFAPCTDSKCKGAERCREDIARLAEWRAERSAGKRALKRSLDGKEHFERPPRKELRFDNKGRVAHTVSQLSGPDIWREDVLASHIDHERELDCLRRMAADTGPLRHDLEGEICALVLKLRGYSYGSIGRALGVSPRRARTLIDRAMKRFPELKGAG